MKGRCQYVQLLLGEEKPRSGGMPRQGPLQTAGCYQSLFSLFQKPFSGSEGRHEAKKHIPVNQGGTANQHRGQ